jgi:serine/threonine-protein kinase
MLSGSVQRRDSLAQGTLIGERYRIVAPLARGGFGTVYVAEQISTERQVALKLLLPQLDGVSVERLLTEARIPSRVNSEHIVQVIDAGIDGVTSAVYLVMELLSGITLAELVKKNGPRPPSETAEYMRQIASGLDKAHTWLDRDGRPAPIIHRDLKPENIFLAKRDDGSPLIKILDFGTAKVLSQTTQISGVLLGTPQYMAYEQAAGEPLTAATDIWAFGLITFYLLTARSYWLAVAREGAYAQLFGEVLTLPLPRASDRARELGFQGQLPPEFDAWFARCVNRDVSQRFPSAGAAANELGIALGIAMRPSSFSETIVARRAIRVEAPPLHALAATTPSSPAALANAPPAPTVFGAPPRSPQLAATLIGPDTAAPAGRASESATHDHTALTRATVATPNRSRVALTAAGSVLVIGSIAAFVVLLARVRAPASERTPANELARAPAADTSTPAVQPAGTTPIADVSEARTPSVTIGGTIDGAHPPSQPPQVPSARVDGARPSDAKQRPPRPRVVPKIVRVPDRPREPAAAPPKSGPSVYEER